MGQTEQVFWALAYGLGVIGAGLFALGTFQHYSAKYAGYRFFTTRRLFGLSTIAALYHGAIYLDTKTEYFVDTPWAMPAMIALAGALALYMIVKSIRHAGIAWAIAGISLQIALLFWLGPFFAIMPPVIIFYALFKDAGVKFRPFAGAPQQTTIYINQSTY